METKEKPLRMFRVSFRSGKWPKTMIAKSASQARYQYWKELDSGHPYEDYLYCLQAESLGLVNAEHLYGDKEAFERMCDNRGITFAFQGMEVDVAGKTGVLVGNYGFNLSVLFPGYFRPSNCHPTWETTYYDELGQVVKCFKEKQRNGPAIGIEMAPNESEV